MAPRGPHACHVPFGPTSARLSVGVHYAHNGGHFGSPSLGSCVGDGDKSMNGHAHRPIGAGHDFNHNDFVRPRLDGGHYSSRPNANCIHLGPRMSPTVPEVPWRTKPCARVFDVDSSQYDSSQYVGIPPRVSDLCVSNYSDATNYGSNFNPTDSYVPLPVGSTSWCSDSGTTHHVCQNASNLHTSTPYSGHPDTGNLTAGPSS
ncbi:hypothetical protein V6Z11_A09G061500 [Gossypium hirsutum]